MTSAGSSIAICALALGLSACTGGLDPILAEVRIQGIEPDDGPISGGTPVTIAGFGFEGDVAVWFDDTPLPTTRVDNFTLVVTSPAASEPGFVDVSVTSATGTDVFEDGFEYVIDGGGGGGGGGGTGTGTGTGTGSGTGTGTGTGTGSATVAPTGLVGGLTQFVLTQIACMDCFPGWYASDIDVWALGAFHDGTALGWTDWWPAQGTCAANPAQTTPTGPLWDAGANLVLATGATNVILNKTVDGGDVSYGATNLSLADFVHPAYYEAVATGGPDVGPTAVANAVLTPEGFASISPIGILSVYPSSSFQVGFSRSAGTTLTWTNTGSATGVHVQMLVFDSTGATVLGEIVCWEPDDGSLYVTPSALSVFPTNSLLAIYMHRTELVDSVIPVNGHTLEGVGQMGVLGTGYVAP